jgi:hypothetical protein
MTTATIKFGQGFEAPWLVAETTNPDPIKEVEYLKEFLIVAFDLEETYFDKPLYVIQIAASILARGYYQDAHKGDGPEKPAEKSEGVSPEGKPAQKRNTKGGLAAQAKASRSSEPEDNTTDVAALIQNATSTSALNDIYEAHDGKNWPAELMAQAKARAEELAK